MHPPPIRAENPLDLGSQKLTLGCPILDRLLAGGFPCGSITEISGESGAGKTQLCLQLLLSSLLPRSSGGLSAASVFIHSEFPFPLRRLRLLSAAAAAALDHVFVRAVGSPDELLAALAAADALISRRPSGRPVRLIVVDSVAALFRSEFDNNAADLKRRSCLFFKIAAKLKEQARKFDSAVVVTNQVVDVLRSDEGSNGIQVGNFRCLWTSGRRVSPALGLSWSNCVNTRLFLSRSDEIVRNDNDSGFGSTRVRRMMLVVFCSPFTGIFV